MVSARKLMQMLHCRRTYRPVTSSKLVRRARRRARARSSYSDDPEPTSGSSTPLNVYKTRGRVKREGNEVHNVKWEGKGDNICRVCLQEGHIPIYGDDHNNDLSQDLNGFTGINVQVDDGYPKHLCQNCYSLLEGAIQLRSTAQNSQKLLIDRVDDTRHSLDEVNDTNNSDDADDTYYERTTRREKDTPEKFRCRKCRIDFDNEEAFHAHRLSEEHEKLKKPCPVCGKEYDATYLSAHMKYHSTKILEVCDVCGKEFTVRGHFIQHRKIHIHELPYKCTWCPYRCRFNYALTVHMRTHTGEKPYQCEHCPEKSFINKSNLNRHLLTHKTGHDFICDMCQRGFYHKVDLENHFKADHMGIKDHICDICDKAFGLRTQLMKHKLKVHRREKLRSGRIPLYLRAEYQKAETENNENAQFTS